jgi:hypothetical protein
MVLTIGLLGEEENIERCTSQPKKIDGAMAPGYISSHFAVQDGGQYPAKTLRRVTQPGFENEQTVGVRCFEGFNPGTV